MSLARLTLLLASLEEPRRTSLISQLDALADAFSSTCGDSLGVTGAIVPSKSNNSNDNNATTKTYARLRSSNHNEHITPFSLASNNRPLQLIELDNADAAYGDLSSRILAFDEEESGVRRVKRARASIIRFPLRTQQLNCSMQESTIDTHEELEEMNSFFAKLEQEETLVIAKENDSESATIVNPKAVPAKTAAHSAWPSRKRQAV